MHSSSSKPKTAQNDDPFISCNDRIGKMLDCMCISAVATQVSEPWPVAQWPLVYSFNKIFLAYLIDLARHFK